jgi:squalene-associated FAD-dependent desaturase
MPPQADFRFNSPMTVLETAIPSASTTTSSPHVIIVGGGLAGMAAAVALEAGGAQVTLLEARRTLGGRAGSFQDPQTGEELDNCQHVLLGCCTNLLDFYARLGVLDQIRIEPAIHFFDPRGRRFDLSGISGLPAPLHLGPAMLRFGALSWAERIALSRAMLAMMRLGREGRTALADVPFGQWLDEMRQPAGLVDKLYDPILTGALNEQCRLASAAYAIQVFQDSLLAHADGYRLGLPACPLSQLYAKLPCQDVRLGVRVSGLRFTPEGIAGVDLAGGESLPADAVVLATNHHTLNKWVPAEWAARDARIAQVAGLQDVPILGAHLWFDRPVLTDSHAAFMTGPLQWLFRKDAEGRAVHGVISAARDWVARPKDECLRLFEAHVRSIFPAARHAKLERGVIVIEKRATYSPLPGSDRFRPHQTPPALGIQNLFLAGDYTSTGWPATMEGAVRSGYLAADGVLASVAAGAAPEWRTDSPANSLELDRDGTFSTRHTRFLRDDLPVQWPGRVLSAKQTR